MQGGPYGDAVFAELAKVLRKEPDAVSDDWKPEDRKVLSLPHIVHSAASSMFRNCLGDSSTTTQRNPGILDVPLEFSPYGNEGPDDPDSDEARFGLTVTIVPDWSAQTYDQALERNPLDLLRGFVRGLRKSADLRLTFHRIIDDSITKGIFVDEESKVIRKFIENAEPFLDNPEAWDSTHSMVLQAKLLRPVCHHTVLCCAVYRSQWG